MNIELRPCTLQKWALCDGYCEKCRTTVTPETVYNCYTDTAGNYHWTGVYSGEHIVSTDGEPTRHGRWLWFDGVRCSLCNHKLQTTGLPSYCPNCGARMDGDDT